MGHRYILVEVVSTGTKAEFDNFIADLRNCKNQESIDVTKTCLYRLECILTSENIEPKIRIEKALAKIREIRSSN